MSSDRRAHNDRQREYFRADKRTMAAHSTPYVRRQAGVLCDAVGLGPGERVLEVGCGQGRYTGELVDRGIALEAVDISEILLDRLRDALGIRSPELHQFDVSEPPAAMVGRFDAVVGFFMLHHVHDLEACMAGMASCLKPGGRIGFVEPNPLNPLYYLQIALSPGMTWAGDGGIVNMRRRRLARAMDEAGIEPSPVKRFGFFPPALANHPFGRKVEDRLERLRPLEPILPFQLFCGRRL